MLHRSRALICLCLIGGCTTFPDLDAGVDPALKNAEFPAFLSQSQLQNLDTPQLNRSVANLEGRLARLRNRAQTLRRPILTAQERRRLAQNIR